MKMINSKNVSSWTTLADGTVVSSSNNNNKSNDRYITEDGTILFHSDNSLSEFDNDYGAYEIEYLNDRNPSRLFRLGTVSSIS
jgi:hypothetical protein